MSLRDETQTTHEEIYCYRHPDTPTRLRCSRCEVPICGSCATPASVGQHCPECLRDAQRSAPKVRSAMAQNAPAVALLVAVNVGIFIVQSLFPGITQRYAMDPRAVAAGEYWRLLTPMVLHHDILHVGMNSFILWIYGPLVEQAFGTRRFIALYLASGLLASTASYSLNECNVLAVGASGAIFGVVGTLLVFLYNRRTSTFMGQYLRGILLFVGLNLFLGFTFPAIDNFAHMGGLAGGIILGLGYDQGAATRPSVALQILITMGLVATTLAIIVWRTTTFTC